MTQTAERPTTTTHPAATERPWVRRTLTALALLATVFAALHALVLSVHFSMTDQAEYESAVGGVLGRVAVCSLVALVAGGLVRRVKQMPRASTVAAVAVLAALGLAETYAILKLTAFAPSF